MTLAIGWSETINKKAHRSCGNSSCDTATFSDLNKTTAGNYTNRRVQFRATTDITLPSTFRVDDVSLR